MHAYVARHFLFFFVGKVYLRDLPLKPYSTVLNRLDEAEYGMYV
jgi:hypothetical protein